MSKVYIDEAGMVYSVRTLSKRYDVQCYCSHCNSKAVGYTGTFPTKEKAQDALDTIAKERKWKEKVDDKG